jgi:hypothetical protein
MAETANMYTAFGAHCLNGIIDISRLKVALLTDSYIPNQDTDAFYDDITSFQVDGEGYPIGGFLLANPTITTDTGTNKTKLISDDYVANDSTITAYYAVFYIDILGADDDEKPLLSWCDLGGAKTSTAGAFTIDTPTDGIVVIPVKAEV